MSKYKVQVIAKQRHTIVVDATDEETAVQGFLDLIQENPDGCKDGLFNSFLMGPEVEITELTEEVTA